MKRDSFFKNFYWSIVDLQCCVSFRDSFFFFFFFTPQRGALYRNAAVDAAVQSLSHV